MCGIEVDGADLCQNPHCMWRDAKADQGTDEAAGREPTASDQETENF
jgi:hypothetical protein